MIDWSNSNIEHRAKATQPKLRYRTDRSKRKHYMTKARKRGFRQEPIDPTPLILPTLIVLVLGGGSLIVGDAWLGFFRGIGLIQ